MMDPKVMIRSCVGLLNGCKATELVARQEMALLEVDIPATLEELVESGDLIEIEYVLPNHPERVKSFLLPKGTEIRVRGVSV